MKIALIIPFYNEEDNLNFFVKEWEDFLNTKKLLRNELYFFFFNDGSTDRSVKKIKENIKKLKFKIINKNNSGHGDTCRYGYNFIINNYEDFDYLLQIDSDNQCDPKYITNFYNSVKAKKYKFIFGYRKYREDGYLRYLISRILSLCVLIKKFIYIKDVNTPYRLMNVKELKKILISVDKNKRYNNIRLFNCALSYAIQKNSKIYWINIKFRKRVFGKSHYNFLNMSKQFINLLVKI